MKTYGMAYVRSHLKLHSVEEDEEEEDKEEEEEKEEVGC